MHPSPFNNKLLVVNLFHPTVVIVRILYDRVCRTITICLMELLHGCFDGFGTEALSHRIRFDSSELIYVMFDYWLSGCFDTISWTFSTGTFHWLLDQSSVTVLRRAAQRYGETCIHRPGDGEPSAMSLSISQCPN